MANKSVAYAREASHEAIVHYQFDILPPSQRLAVFMPSGIVALVDGEQKDAPLRAVTFFTPNEMLLLLPVLAWYPDFAGYPELLARFEHGPEPTQAQITTALHKVNLALSSGTFEAMIRPVRNVMSRNRLKLHLFGLDIVALLETGYLLKPWARWSASKEGLEHVVAGSVNTPDTQETSQ